MKLAPAGKVISGAVSTTSKNPSLTHRGFLDVEWQAEPRNKEFPNVVFPRFTVVTVAELWEEKYHEFVGSAPTPTTIPELSAEPIDKSAFALEKYLEEF